MRRQAQISVQLQDQAGERARRSLEDRLSHLEASLRANGKLVQAIELPDATDVPVRHGFGRGARAFLSAPYAKTGTPTDGSIRDVTRASGLSRDQYVVLHASGWGQTIYVDVVIL